MTLSRNMLNGRYLVCLRELKQLKQLTILAKYWMDRLESCCGLMEYLLQVKELEVRFGWPYSRSRYVHNDG